jgi:hypothetical protein
MAYFPGVADMLLIRTTFGACVVLLWMEVPTPWGVDVEFMTNPALTMGSSVVLRGFSWTDMSSGFRLFSVNFFLLADSFRYLFYRAGNDLRWCDCEQLPRCPWFGPRTISLATRGWAVITVVFSVLRRL